MCNFASFVLTKDKVFWLQDSDSHSEIIRRNDIHESGTHGLNIVKVEIRPTSKLKKWHDYAKWELIFDQDQFPKWHDAVTSETALPPRNIVPPDPTWKNRELSLVTSRRPSVPELETLDCTS